MSSSKSSSSRKKQQVTSPRSRKICKFLIPSERSKIEAAAQLIGSFPTEKGKVEATKQYFKQYWFSLVHHYHSRKARDNKRLLYIRQHPELTDEQRDNYLNEQQRMETLLLRYKRTRMTKNDFMLLAILGRGGFGEVYLARKRDTGEVVALKKMSKAMFVQKNDVMKVKRERAVMLQHNSPWLIKLKYSFQSNDYVYLAMEFAPGGDMKNLLDHVGCFAEDHTRFYISEMLLAVEALHKLGYIHRDLKPDNFLVDRTGHLKLIDFGLSKDGLLKKYSGTFTMKMNSVRNNTLQKAKALRQQTGHLTRRQQMGGGRKAYSVVGSPEYMAIEILEEVGYNHTVDYWSLGIILFELFYGITPFTSDTVDETFQKLTIWQEYIVAPEPIDEEEVPISDDAWDLVTGLLTEPNVRLGRSTVDELKSHPFFKGIVWDDLLGMEPPFIPSVCIRRRLDDEFDTSYYHDSLTDDDYAALSIDATDVQQILDANLQDPDTIPLHLINFKASSNTETPSNVPTSTHFKNEYKESAFAGWTYRHDDLDALLNQIDDTTIDD